MAQQFYEARDLGWRYIDDLVESSAPTTRTMGYVAKWKPVSILACSDLAMMASGGYLGAFGFIAANASARTKALAGLAASGSLVVDAV